jgi:hypothetical protein
VLEESNMKNILKLILSGIIFFGTAPTVSSMDYSEKAGMEEIKKKKKKGKKIKKKGFFSKFKGAK